MWPKGPKSLGSTLIPICHCLLSLILGLKVCPTTAQPEKDFLHIQSHYKSQAITLLPLCGHIMKVSLVHNGEVALSLFWQCSQTATFIVY